MNLLIADGDRAQAELLRGLLEREGHVTQVVSDSSRVPDALRAGRVEGLVLSLSLGVETVSAVEGVLTEPGRNNARLIRRVVVLATPDEARKSEVISFLGSVTCAVCLRRPAPMFDLADQFRFAASTSAPPAVRVNAKGPSPVESLASFVDDGATSHARVPDANAYLGSPLHGGNLRTIAGLWSRAASGRLTLSESSSGARGWMMWGLGGALDSRGLELVSAALHGGELRFESLPVRGSGDRIGMGVMIVGRAREADGSRWLLRCSYLAVHRLVGDPPLQTLPLDPRSRLLLRPPDPGTPLGELLAAPGVDARVVAADLQVLEKMGLIELGHPLVRPAAGAPSRSLRQPPPTRPRPPVSDPESENTSIASNSRPRESRANALRVQRRLEAEVQRLRGASPGVVLGLAAESSSEQVDEMVERLSERYNRLIQDPETTSEAQPFARELLAMIKPAAASFRERGGPVSLNREVELLRAQGQRRLAAGEVGEALKALRAALRRDTSNAEVLAELGWVTRLDPTAGVEEREESALTYATLAVQLGPHLWLARYTLARLLCEVGSLREALAEAQAAERLEPGRAETADLQSLIQRRLIEQRPR